MNIHIGGIDLKFPHHFNEIIQANAFYHPEFSNQNLEWCKNFYHVGHLNCVTLDDKGNVIDEQKMAKSKKNYVSIKKILNEYSSNIIRWCFFDNNWRKPTAFSDNLLSIGKSHDQLFTAFFEKVKHQKYVYSDDYNSLSDIFNKTTYDVLEATFDFNFHYVFEYLHTLIKQILKCMSQESFNIVHIREIRDWILSYLTKMGFNYECNDSTDKTDDIMNILIDTRSQIKKVATDKCVDNQTKKKLFEIMDDQRNIKLRYIGIQLEDQSSGCIWQNIN